jgi:hypothetical protein
MAARKMLLYPQARIGYISIRYIHLLHSWMDASGLGSRKALKVGFGCRELHV